MCRRFLAVKPRPYSSCNCRDSVETIASPYSARLSFKTSWLIRRPMRQQSMVSPVLTAEATETRVSSIICRTSRIKRLVCYCEILFTFHGLLFELPLILRQFPFSLILLIGQFLRKTGRLRPIQSRFYAILLAMSITQRGPTPALLALQPRSISLIFGAICSKVSIWP